MILYVYAGYPLAAAVCAAIAKKRVVKGDDLPSVTILISAYNEKECIGATLENKLGLDYPGEKREIIVISDGSTDGTDEIVGAYASRGVRLLRQEPRQGKTAALNSAVPEAQGEILVFSDANSIYEPDALRRLVRNFSDPTVGYVTGKMIYRNPDGSGIGDGCSAYMKYENLLRRIETQVGSVVGVDGGIDAVRRILYQPMNADQLPDFVLPLKVIAQGFRVVYEPEAVLVEPTLQTTDDEYRMRVRVSLRALWALKDMRSLLSFRRFRLFAWQLWSHKALRYCCFIFLILAFVSNAALWRAHEAYKALFLIQSAIYLAFVCQLALGLSGRSSKVLYLLHYFMLLNLASAHAFLKFILGRKQVVWTPRKG
jgi:glycosyltransferase involved in cell wall biosynthesis